MIPNKSQAMCLAFAVTLQIVGRGLAPADSRHCVFA